MKETTKAYLAGILDGDGYFTIKRSTYAMRNGDATQPVFSEKVGIKQIAPNAIDILHENFGGYRRIEKSSAKKGKPLHAWSVTDKKAIRVVEAVFPYLKIKRRQAEMLLKLRETKINVVRVKVGTFEMRHKSGKIVTMSRRIVSPEIIRQREQLCSNIKKLNDTRVNQPKLI